MNKSQFKKNVGDRFRLRPRPYDLNVSPIDDEWILEHATDHVRLRNARTNGQLMLGFDHMQKFSSDPERGADAGFLLLDVNVVEQPDGRFTYEPIIRGGSGDRPVVPPALTWQDIEGRFQDLRKQESEVADGGRGERPLSAVTSAEPDQPEQWGLMGGSMATQADTDRLCRIAGGKLRDPKWRREEADDFARWLGFVAEVGGHTRHLHSASRRGDQPTIYRDDYWIRDLVPECVAAVREALTREQLGTYATPEKRTHQWASAFWKKGGVQSIRVKNETDDVMTGIKVIVRDIEWRNERSKWVIASDVPENYFPKILSAGSSRITSGAHADFTFISEPTLTEPRIQMQDLDGSNMKSLRLDQHGDRRVRLEIVGDGQRAESMTLVFRWEKNKAPEAL